MTCTDTAERCFFAENYGDAEYVAFGIGIAVLLLGRNWFITRTVTSGRATTAWLATVWLFASWMPRGSLHQHIGMRLGPLLAVEWIFHIGTALVSAALLCALGTGRIKHADEEAILDLQLLDR